ncbi:hypothetical protein SUGI_0454530 [Cryptomeria japonica]|uniref:uncharacterized protein LOC131057393 n=1 Tax=Cryptomeria japonica TaxID=3369 RepID=UPI002408DD24|nr:uncharacterized protein LOC131057393 [Cryptomeria japonica]GLJ23920.1 hypothetical protein SUGI_0454530 [Cryptomeria japonica]
MNLSPIPPPFSGLVHTCGKCTVFCPYIPNSLIHNYKTALLVGRSNVRLTNRLSYKWNSSRDKREFGYWDSDSESFGGAKFKSRIAEDDAFDDSNPWWSEEYDRDDYDDYEDSSQLKWGSTSVQQALRSWTWILPAVLIPWLLGNPMAIIMALFFPLAQSAVGSLFEQAWRAILGSVAPAPPKPKRKRKTASYRNGWNESDTRSSNRDQSTTYDEPELDTSGSTPPESRQKYSWADPDKSMSAGVQGGLNLGGWEDLDSGIERPVRTKKQNKKSKLSRKIRRREVPLFFRLLVAFFPFLGFWGKYL